ncbi:hypothetical protein MRX96_053658 [Rhipicephalus microplus]
MLSLTFTPFLVCLLVVFCMWQQEPGGSGEEILAGIRYVRPGNDYVPNFRLVRKLDVNGETQHPLFEFLKRRHPVELREVPRRSRRDPPLRRYDPNFLPRDMEDDIEDLTSEGALPPVEESMTID